MLNSKRCVLTSLSKCTMLQWSISNRIEQQTNGPPLSAPKARGSQIHGVCGATTEKPSFVDAFSSETLALLDPTTWGICNKTNNDPDWVSNGKQSARKCFQEGRRTKRAHRLTSLHTETGQRKNRWKCELLILLPNTIRKGRTWRGNRDVLKNATIFSRN